MFEAERGQGWAADIALDEIRLTPGDCSQFVATTTQPPPTTKPTPAAKQGTFSGVAEGGEKGVGGGGLVIDRDVCRSRVACWIDLHTGKRIVFL